MKRTTAQNLRFYFVTTLIMVCILSGFIISPNNNSVTQLGESSGGDSSKPFAHLTPSLNTTGYFFTDDFVGYPMGNLWINNTKAIARGATFDTTTPTSYLTIHTPNTNIFPQNTTVGKGDQAAYSNYTLSSKLAGSRSTWTIETKMTALNSTIGKYWQAGLMIRFQDNVHMYFYGPFAQTVGSNRSISARQTTSNNNGSAIGSAVTLGSPPSAWYLRITKNATTYYFLYSTNGVTWTRQTQITNAQQPKGVGLIVRTWSWRATDVTAKFDYFRISVEGEVDVANPSSISLRCGQIVTVQTHIRYYSNKTNIAFASIGLVINGSLDKVMKTNGTGWVTFSKNITSPGTRRFDLFVINNTVYNLKPFVNKTLYISWTGFTVTVNAVNHEGEPAVGAGVRLQYSADGTDGRPPQTINATGYYRFTSVSFASYYLNVTQQLYNSSSTAYYTKTVTLGTVSSDFTEPVSLDTTKLLVHVKEHSSGIPLQGAVVKLLNGSGSPWQLVGLQTVNLTAWAYFIILSGKEYNLTVWYGGAQRSIIYINQTSVNNIWYSFTSDHRWYFEVNATSGGTPPTPTTLTWRVQPVTTRFWDEDFVLSVWLNDSMTNTGISAAWINCTVGSFSGALSSGGSTGNYVITIPAHLVGNVPSGLTSKTFTISINAAASGTNYARPPPIVTDLVVEAFPLSITWKGSYSTYWGCNTAFWVDLAYLNATLFNGATFTVNLDGVPTGYAFSSIGNGNYTLLSTNAFGLPLGNHSFQVILASDNYCLSGRQSIYIWLYVSEVPASITLAQYDIYDESLQLQSGSTVYWNWTIHFNIGYMNVINGSPVSDALVDIMFTKTGLVILESLASYDAVSGKYSAVFESMSFPTADIYAYTIMVSRTGYSSKISSGAVNLQWRPVSISFSRDRYDSIRGLFGGDSSVRVEVTLMDTLKGSPLTGANVSYTWQYGTGNFTEVGGGDYVADVYANDRVPVDVYILTVSVNKLEYQQNTITANMQVDFTGGHVLLPIVGVVPLSMFAIILGAVAVVGGIGGLRAYVWATTPYIIKRINRILHAVEKGTQAEPISGLRTRAQTPMHLLSGELESADISLEKATTATTEVTGEVESEEVELEEVEAEPERPKRRTERIEEKTEEAEIKEEKPKGKPPNVEVKEESKEVEVKQEEPKSGDTEVKTEGLEFEKEDLELGTEPAETEAKEPDVKPEKEASAEKGSKDSGKEASDGKKISAEKPEEGGN